MGSKPAVAIRIEPATPWKRDVAILVLFHVALGLVYLKTVPRFYNDDAWEASLGHSLAYAGTLRHGIIEGWGGMHVHFVQDQVVQPIVLAAVYRLAGFGIVTSRLASVLFGAIAVVAVYGVMRHWLGARRALVATVATIVHPWFFEVTRRIRPDIYAVALAFAGLGLLVRALADGGRVHALGAGLLAGLAGLAHPTGFVLDAALAAGVLIGLRPRHVMSRVAWVLAGGMIAVLPYVAYVVWAVQDPQVSFLEQMRGGKAVVLTGLWDILVGEWRRWRHFLQWPKGAPLAVMMLVSWLAAWHRSTRADKAMATAILFFAAAMPFTTVNYTSRYLTGLIPLFAALLVRLVDRVVTGAHDVSVRRRGWRWAIGGGMVLVYLGSCLAAIGLMFHRLHGADLTGVLDRVAAVTGRDARVYGEMLLWMGQDRYRYGPYPLDDRWQTSVEQVARHRFDYAVRSAWVFSASEGVNRPPATMPPWRPAYIVDKVCRDFGTRVAAFRDPYFGPMEVYRLDWDGHATH